MRDVRLIAAIGRRGQIGLNGHLPWGHEKGDLATFARITAGGVLLMGWATARNLDGHKLVRGGRVLALVTRDGLALVDGANPVIRVDCDFQFPDLALDVLGSRFPDRTIWVAGGAQIYAAFGPYCQRFCLTLIDYDGDADRYLPPLPWEAQGGVPGLSPLRSGDGGDLRVS